MNKTTIYFKYGAMNSGKSLDLIKNAYNYKERGLKCLVLKPKSDTRAKGKVTTRANLEIAAVEFDETSVNDTLTQLKQNKAEIILIDESNFLTKEVVDAIIDYSYNNNVHTVMFYGLKVDFQGQLFEGSKRIIERADKIEEATSICWCGKKARQNARISNGKIIKQGQLFVIDDEKSKVEYQSLCNYHFHVEKLS